MPDLPDTDLTIRAAVHADLDAIVAMLADDPIGATRERPGAPAAAAYQDAFAAMDADPNQELIVADDAGRAVGCLELSFLRGLSRMGMLRAQIESVRVARHLRGRGVGNMLFAHAIARARDRGAAIVQLTSDKARPDAIRFYEQLGFTASHEGLKRSLAP